MKSLDPERSSETVACRYLPKASMRHAENICMVLVHGPGFVTIAGRLDSTP
jgi:hypothetical protein